MGAKAMMTCKDVSTLVSLGDVGSWSVSRRLAIRLHLLMCRHCRAFARQVEMLTHAARGTGARVGQEPPPTFETAIVDRLRKG
ncbi:MAG: zf-HC2 domain-containing protein [Vicinamibacterales bacterium]